jgi:protein-S-isoprenylcysteine O-methyltransferase Ste14
MPNLPLALATAAGLLAIFGLAAFGWGGVAALLADPARVGLVLVTVALAGAASFSAANLSPGLRWDRADRRALLGFAVVGLALAYVPALTDRLDLWSLGGDGVRWVGLLVYTAGGLLRIAPLFVLGRRFSGLVAIQPGHDLVTTGLYGRIRHPSYLGMLVAAVGWSLVFRSLAGLLLSVALLVPLVARIRAEERLLAAAFGPRWHAWAARTDRLMPGVW